MLHVLQVVCMLVAHMSDTEGVSQKNNTLLHTYVLRVQFSCGIVLDFWFWREIVFDVTYVLSVQYSCAVVSGFCCGRK
jgi:hypothetical protein